jgi:hypothetical protein
MKKKPKAAICTATSMTINKKDRFLREGFSGLSGTISTLRPH